MNRIIRITLSISCLLLCLFWFGCRSGSENARNPTIQDLSDSLMYDDVLKRLNGTQWERETDPWTIMIYCGALVETKRPLPREMVSPPVPQHVSRFIRGYYSFRQGKLRESLRIFSELAQDKEHHIWGDLGILEFSLATGSISNMKRPLESLEEETRKAPAVARTLHLPVYKAWYGFFSGQYDQAEKILNDHKDGIDAMRLSELQVTMLLRQDRFNEAEAIIKRMPPGFQVTAELESALINLKYGSKKWLEFLGEKRKKYPQFWVIESKYADALVDSGQIDAATEVRKKLAHARPFDVFVQLAFASHQLYHGNFEEAREYLVHLDYPPEVDYYDVLLAKMYSKQDLDVKAWEYLKLAKKLFPRSPYALAGITGMALKERDYNKMYGALKERLEIDPNDIQVLVFLMLVDCLRNEYDELWQIEKRVNSSKRYIDQEMREKIGLVKSKCGNR
jgi:hypothetical protein